MTTQRTYVVTRHGSNAANQHMCQSLDIGTVEARNRTEAKEKADDAFGCVCYNNQRLTVTPGSRVCAARWNALVESLALDEVSHV